MFEAMRSTLRDRFENGLKYNETMKNFAIDKVCEISLTSMTCWCRQNLICAIIISGTAPANGPPGRHPPHKQNSPE